MPLTVDLEALHPGPPDREALRRLFVELEFTKLVKELGFDSRPEGTCSLVQGPGDLDRVVQAVREAGAMGLGFVMSEQHPVLAEVAGVGLAWQTGEGAYIPLAAGESNRTVWEKLGPVWSDAGIAKVGADLKAALLLAQRFGPDLEGITGDILLASYLLNPARYEQNLENVALHYLGVNLPGPRELAGRPTTAVGLDRDLACQYAAQRAEVALRLWPRLEGRTGKGRSLGALCRPGIAAAGHPGPHGGPGDSPGPGISPALRPGPGRRRCSGWSKRFMPWPGRNFSSSRPSNWAASSLRK